VAEPERSLDEVAAFLATRHGDEPITDLVHLSGGHWSSAFAYRVGDRDLVLRLGRLKDGYEADRAAMAYAGPDLPVPEVLEIGDAFGGAYAISVRSHGRFLEDVAPDEADRAGPTITRLLGALHAARVRDVERIPSTAWRDFLVGGFVDDPAQTVSGWRRRIAADADLDLLFRTCEARVRDLAANACPERRDVVHGDLLHQNVLVNDDATAVTAVFSWKCSVPGDFLFDAAWCTLWGHVHPGIAAADVWGRVLGSDWALADPAALVDAPARHHCYELQIAGSHLGWYAWTGDDDRLRDHAAHTAMLLERGPLTAPPAAASPSC
jgi:aminoglycoside phosphotransferase (APT) family kinase protein